MTTEYLQNTMMFENSEMYVYHEDISYVFKKIKNKELLNTKIIIDLSENSDEKLIEARDFIDKVIYYRKNKHYTPALMAKKIGIDRDTYYQYENRTFKLHDVKTINKIVQVLEMTEDDMPDYIKFVINNPLEKIKDFMKRNKLSRKQFASNSNIPLCTVNKWFINKGQISIKNFNKLKSYISDKL